MLKNILYWLFPHLKDDQLSYHFVLLSTFWYGHGFRRRYTRRHVYVGKFPLNAFWVSTWLCMLVSGTNEKKILCAQTEGKTFVYFERFPFCMLPVVFFSRTFSFALLCSPFSTGIFRLSTSTAKWAHRYRKPCRLFVCVFCVGWFINLSYSSAKVYRGWLIFSV